MLKIEKKSKKAFKYQYKLVCGFVIDDDKWITSMKSCQVHYERNESRIIQVSKFSLKHSVRLHTLQAFGGGGPPPTSYKGGCMSEYEMGKNQVNFLTGADRKFFLGAC